jgi:hypothetical protein
MGEGYSEWRLVTYQERSSNLFFDSIKVLEAGMDEPIKRDERASAIRRHTVDFLERLRNIDPDLLVELAIELRPDRLGEGFKLKVTEGELPPLPFDKGSFDKTPFKDVPFRDTPWHDHARPPNRTGLPEQS